LAESRHEKLLQNQSYNIHLAKDSTTRAEDFSFTGLVSVVVVNWNRKDMLELCLRSIKGQINPRGEEFPHEVIVVDNGSDDGSVEMVSTVFPQARLIRNPRNEGFCRANNQGIAAARGTHIALLNNDAEAAPCWLYELSRAFTAGPYVGMAASKVVCWQDAKRIDKVGHVIYSDGQNRGRGTGERDCGQYERIEEVLWPDGCAAMYSREMLDRVGGFDEDFFAYADDADLGFRGRIAGYKCLYMPRAVVRHRRSSTLGLGSAARISLIERNRIYLTLKLFPWSLVASNPYHFIRRVIAGMRNARGGMGDFVAFPGMGGKLRIAWGLLRGQAMAIAGAVSMLRKRSDVKRYAVMTMAERKQLILASSRSIRDFFAAGGYDEVAP
jgi:GT2 family glycosyltransferase